MYVRMCEKFIVSCFTCFHTCFIYDTCVLSTIWHLCLDVPMVIHAQVVNTTPSCIVVVSGDAHVPRDTCHAVAKNRVLKNRVIFHLCACAQFARDHIWVIDGHVQITRQTSLKYSVIEWNLWSRADINHVTIWVIYGHVQIS